MKKNSRQLGEQMNLRIVKKTLIDLLLNPSYENLRTVKQFGCMIVKKNILRREVVK